MELYEFLKKHGQQVFSYQDAEARWSNGERIFYFPEMDNRPIEITDFAMLQNTGATPDLLMAVPADVFDSETATQLHSNAGAELARLKQNIKIELDLCDPIDTPFVCTHINAADGYEKIEHLIIQKILSEKITISQAIIQIENDLDPNSYEAF